VAGGQQCFLLAFLDNEPIKLQLDSGNGTGSNQWSPVCGHDIARPDSKIFPAAKAVNPVLKTIDDEDEKEDEDDCSNAYEPGS
jgi:hypothetical protein